MLFTLLTSSCKPLDISTLLLFAISFDTSLAHLVVTYFSLLVFLIQLQTYCDADWEIHYRMMFVSWQCFYLLKMQEVGLHLQVIH